jgi:hypothetical protein
VGEAAAAIDAQVQAKFAAAVMSQQKKTRAREKLKDRMREVIKTSRGVARVTPDARKAFRLPVRRSDVALLTAARACLRAAKPIEADGIELGLPATFLQELCGAIDDFDRVTRDRRVHRAAAAAAQKSLTAASANGFAAVRTLDIVVTNVLRDDSVRLAAWRARPPTGRQQEKATASNDVEANAASFSIPRGSTVVAWSFV